MSADDLAPCITKLSAAMKLTSYKWVCVFRDEEFQLLVAFHCQELISQFQQIFPENNSACPELM